MSRSSVCWLGLVFVVSGSAVARAADWPQWGGRDSRNMISEEKGLPVSFEPGRKKPHGDSIDPATTKNVKWVAWLGSLAYGNPTVAGGRVFVGTDDLSINDDPRLDSRKAGLVKCFDEATGKLLWQLPSPQTAHVLPPNALFTHQFLGTCSSPTVDGDRVYVVTSDCQVACLDVHGLANGNDGPFKDEGQYMAGAGKPPLALQPTDGDIVWLYDLIGQLGVCPHDAASCSILIHGDVLYLSTSNGRDKAHERVINPNAPAFIALDKHTGRLVASEGEKLSTRLYHCQWCSPSLGKVGDKNLIFVGGGDGVCYAFEALETLPKKPVQMKKVWSCDCCPEQYKYRGGKPIAYYDGDRRKGKGNKNDGKWVGPSEIIATPVFSNHRVYVAIGQDPAHGRGRGMLTAIDATRTGDITKTGKLWTCDGMDRTISTVTISDGLVYAPDVAGRLHCLDADTGKVQWVYDTKAETWGSPLVADGKVYLGTKNAFYVLTASRHTPQVLAKLNLGSPVFSSPILANGVLYVASQRYLWAVGGSR